MVRSPARGRRENEAVNVAEIGCCSAPLRWRPELAAVDAVDLVVRLGVGPGAEVTDDVPGGHLRRVGAAAVEADMAPVPEGDMEARVSPLAIELEDHGRSRRLLLPPSSGGVLFVVRLGAGEYPPQQVDHVLALGEVDAQRVQPEADLQR